MLNPLHDSGRDAWASRIVNGNVYETLAELDRTSSPRYQLRPRLAERWELSPDLHTQTFHLRRDVVFHDGQPFTSKDVTAVLSAVMDPKLRTATVRSAFSELSRWEAPDAHTVILHWKRPSYYGFRFLATSLPILPHRRLAGDWDGLAIHRQPVGTGPFRFVSWNSGTALTFERNAAYWRAPAHLSRVVFKVVRDPTAAVKAWEQGEFDLMTSIPPTVWRALERPDAERNGWAWTGYHRIRFDENNYGWMGWNHARPLFQDARVRRALAHLYPAEEIARGIEWGLHRPATCPYDVNSAFCDAEVTPLRHDPLEAKGLLEAAGWVDRDNDGVREKDGTPFQFTFLVHAHSEHMNRLAPLLQEHYRKAGIRMEIERVEWARFLERLRAHDFDAASLLWSSQDTEVDLYPTFHSSQTSAFNYVSYAHAEVDALILQARTEFDDVRRAELGRRLHRLLYDDQAYQFLSHRPALDAVKVHVRGLQPALNGYDLRQIWLERPLGAGE